jgi:pimeloyl-ACP methyl ester carboxylesterase
VSAFLEWGAGRPVVCLHGIGGAAHLWAATAAGLPGRRVLAWNQPGYGGTALLDPLSFPALADALAEQLQPAQVDLIGHSMGGMIAREFALRYPGRVRRLVLYATTPAFGGRDPSFAQAFMAARLGPLDSGKTMAECAASMAGGMSGPVAHPAAEPAIIAAMAEVPEASYRATLACLATFDRREAIAGITAPTLCLAGELDKAAPARTVQRMAETIPGARYAVVAGAGHMLHLEQPAKFQASISQFLADI